MNSYAMRTYAIVLFMSCALLQGCSTGGAIVGGVLTTAFTSRAPTDEITQVYYLGVFDRQEQVPPQLYRVRVVGQASALNSTRYASGWVDANLIDSLSGRLAISQSGVKLSPEANGPDLGTDDISRRLILFGPEGLREVPSRHRLVIIAGADPSAFFEAIDQASIATSIASSVGEEASNVIATSASLAADVKDLDRAISEMSP